MNLFLKIISEGVDFLGRKKGTVITIAILSVAGYLFFSCKKTIAILENRIKENIVIRQENIQDRLNQSLGEKDENITIPDTVGTHIIKL